MKVFILSFPLMADLILFVDNLDYTVDICKLLMSGNKILIVLGCIFVQLSCDRSEFQCFDKKISYLGLGDRLFSRTKNMLGSVLCIQNNGDFAIYKLHQQQKQWIRKRSPYNTAYTLKQKTVTKWIRVF